MTNDNSIHKAALAALAAIGLWALTHLPAARAQVADDVVCDQCVGKGDIVDKAVTAVKIKSNSIFSPKIQDRSIEGIDIGIGAVGTDEIADGSVTSADIADGTITSLNIATDGVGAAEIGQRAVGSDEVINESLTADDLAPDSVGADELFTDAVGADEIAEGAVASGEVVNDSLTSDDLAPDSVTASELTLSAVGASEVVANSLTAVDLRDNAFVAGSGSVPSKAIGTTDQIVIDRTINPVSTGWVMVVTNGTFQHVLFTVKARCSITTGTTVDPGNNPLIEAELTSEIDLVPFSGVRTFAVLGGETTFNLVCDLVDGAPTGDQAIVLNAELFALYFPTAY